ncbi:MAG: NADH-quinone oxidoreductase subunit L [Deltaproteobacteria bacterium]|nr:NADH-quinone oxidoreductase subunit L [Deltaproteobacteria bacterium]
MMDYVWLVPFFPLCGVIINGLVGVRFPRRVIGPVACAAIGLSFLVSCGIMIQLVGLPPEQRVLEQVVFTWLESGSLKVSAGFMVDPLSAVMMLVVSGVSFLIHIYSIGYMWDNEYGTPGYRRFFVYLNLFVMFMLILVSANNFLMMFIGWEGVGLCSYLLIGFEHLRKAASDAGKKAFVVNRVGDFGFLLGMMLIFAVFGSLDFSVVLAEAPHKFAVGAAIPTAITLLLFVGATGKSAQIPLYTWLPDAMEGPTPVSALIHAATMVTAGVYMVSRASTLFLMAPVSMTVVAVIGAATAIYAASIGLVQNDIKRVLAYSTISQLGYMFLACGVGAFAVGIFHLMTHAFFKACLFLCAGSVMHATSGELDMRKMGGLREHLPVTYWTYLVSALAIAGIFPFSGFFSKDEILWESLTGPYGHVLLWVIGVTAALMTAFYMFRTVYMTFHGEERYHHHGIHLHHEIPIMNYILIILAFLATFGGLVGLPLIEGGNKIGEFLHPVVSGHGLPAVAEAEKHYPHLVEFLFMLISLAVAGVGIYTAYRMYRVEPELPERTANRFPHIYQMLFNKYKVDEAYDVLFVNSTKGLSNFFWRIFDTRLIDSLCVEGSAFMVRGFGIVLRQIQTGYVQNYALSIVVGVVLILGLYFLGR